MHDPSHISFAPLLYLRRNNLAVFLPTSLEFITSHRNGPLVGQRGGCVRSSAPHERADSGAGVSRGLTSAQCGPQPAGGIRPSRVNTAATRRRTRHCPRLRTNTSSQQRQMTQVAYFKDFLGLKSHRIGQGECAVINIVVESQSICWNRHKIEVQSSWHLLFSWYCMVLLASY
jgi:hypothetical protein